MLVVIFLVTLVFKLNDAMTQAEIETCVNSANMLRGLHANTLPLQWSAALAAAASQWANYLAQRNELIHASNTERNGAGENLYWSSSSKPAVCAQANLKWYEEYKYYNYATGLTTTPGKAVGHFTQLVWKSTTEFGVGIATKTVGNNIETFIVARYTPAGNVRHYGANPMEYYFQNVMARKAGATTPTLEQLDPSLQKPCTNEKGSAWCNYFINSDDAYGCDHSSYGKVIQDGCYKMCGLC